MVTKKKAAGEFKEGAGPGALWAGMLAAPLAMLVELQVNYALVVWACKAGGREWPLHLVAFAALAVSAAGGLLSWRNWRLAGGRWYDEDAGVMPRSSFMAAVGVMVSALIVLVVVAQWIPVFIHGTCQR